MTASIKIGDTCVLQGLKAQPSFNGHKVKVVEWMAKEGRFVLKPVSASTPLPPVLAIRPDNLKLDEEKTNSAEKFPVGTILILRGLKSQNQFNGHRVVVSGFLFDQGRYKVRPEDPDSELPSTLAIKPENLEPASTQDGRGIQKSWSSRSIGFLANVGQRRRGTMGAMQHTSHRDEPSLKQSRQRGMIRRNSCPRISANHLTDGTHEIGGTYQLEGLRSVPHFNGQVVTVKSYLISEDRYQVCPIDTNGPLPAEFAVKPANLVSVIESSPNKVAPGLTRSASSRSQIKMVRSYSQKSLVLPIHQMRQHPTESENGRLSRQNSITGLVADNGVDIASIKPGDKMMIVGLQSRPDWNGEKVTVNQYVQEQSRYQVAPLNRLGDMPELMLLKPSNLRAAPEERVPQDIAFSSSDNNQEYDQGTDDVSSLESNRSTQKPYSVGAEVIILRSLEPELEGLKFRVTQVFDKPLEYKLEPVGPEAMDACRGGDVTMSHDDLMDASKKEKPKQSHEENHGKEILQPGQRGVIQDYSASLNGHLVKVVSFNSRRKSYLVEPLGKLARKSVGSSAISLAFRNLTPAPPAAFWTTVNKKGRRMYVPCHATVYKTRSGQNAFTAYISCFPGVEKVAPLARVLLGEDRCNWDDLEEVKNVLAKSGSNSIAVDVKDSKVRKLVQDDEIVLKPNKHANTIDALVEYELIEKTERSIHVEEYGVLPVYKLTYDFAYSSKPCDNSDASPTTVLSTTHTEATVRQSNGRKTLTKAFSVTLLESEGMGNDNAREPMKKERSSRKLKAEKSDRRLRRRSSSKRLNGRSRSSSRSLSSNYVELQTAIAEREAEKKKLEEELQALRETIQKEKAALLVE